jgi:hypothetical protein
MALTGSRHHCSIRTKEKIVKKPRWIDTTVNSKNLE